MAKKKSFAVIGLGQFGRAVTEELVANNQDVICIDSDEESVRKMSAIIPTSFVADATDEQALIELGIQDCDAVIVAFGNNKEASVLTTVLLKQLGVKRIVVRVDDDYYVPIMKKLGADEVITPQHAMGTALANRIGNVDYVDYYKLDEEFSIVSIQVRPDFQTSTIKELASNSKYGVNVVLIKTDGVAFAPSGSNQIKGGDIIYVVGTSKGIRDFRKAING